ncbi:unnamed protein product [Camellia sinensis]
MEPFNTSSVSRTPSYSLKAKATSVFREGISMHLSGWNGLQMAIQNKWGGSDSLKKFDQLTSDILSWFSQSKGLFLFLLPHKPPAPEIPFHAHQNNNVCLYGL